MKAYILSNLIVIFIILCGINCQDKVICSGTITINNINYCCPTGSININNLVCRCCSTPTSCTNCIILVDTTTKPTQPATTSTKLTLATTAPTTTLATTVVTTESALSTTKRINCPGSLTISTSNINGVIVKQFKCCVTSSQRRSFWYDKNANFHIKTTDNEQSGQSVKFELFLRCHFFDCIFCENFFKLKTYNIGLSQLVFLERISTKHTYAQKQAQMTPNLTKQRNTI